MPSDFPDSLDADLKEVGKQFVEALERGDHDEANRSVKEAWKSGVSKQRLHLLIPFINARLREFESEWTSHGIRRTFRFWTAAEKKAYLEYTNRVRLALSTLSDQVSLAYGAALAVARDGDLIPHDDDLDLLIGLDRSDYPTFSLAFAAISETLSTQGFLVHGNYPAHRHVIEPSTKLSIDLFVGIFECPYISSVPGRRGTLLVTDVFPPKIASMHGVDLAIPQQLDSYLENVYGPGWRHPDPTFEHSWDTKPFEDLL